MKLKLHIIKKYFYIMVLLLFGHNIFLFSQIINSADTTYLTDESDYYIDNEINWNKLFDILLYSQNKLVNHPMISISTGLSLPNLSDRVSSASLPTNNFFNIEYGFVRYDNPYRLKSINDFSSEFAFMEYNTNEYGLFNAKGNSGIQNIFSFGIGLRSGLGISLFNNNNQIYGLHSTAFTWSNFYYDNFPDDKHFQIFHKNWKFGNKGIATVGYRFNTNINLDLEYEHINIYSGMEYGKWIGSWFFDLVLQRWIDILDPLFIEQMGETYPLIKFLYKNSIAIILSEARAIKQFYPFNSDYSLLDRRIGVKLKFVF